MEIVEANDELSPGIEKDFGDVVLRKKGWGKKIGIYEEERKRLKGIGDVRTYGKARVMSGKRETFSEHL